jgi:hypothetical protein
MRFSRRSQPPSSDARRRPLEKIALPDRRGFLSHIAAVDLDIAVIGQLSAAQLPLGDVLEPRSVQVITLNGTVRILGGKIWQSIFRELRASRRVLCLSKCFECVTDEKMAIVERNIRMPFER